jgi:hypothetical protein
MAVFGDHIAEELLPEIGRRLDRKKLKFYLAKYPKGTEALVTSALSLKGGGGGRRRLEA